jgi:hypothetical protein
MSLNASLVGLRHGLRTLNALWDDLRPVWNDAVRRDFEDNHWGPLRAHADAALLAAERLGPVLERALQETSPSP